MAFAMTTSAAFTTLAAKPVVASNKATLRGQALSKATNGAKVTMNSKFNKWRGLDADMDTSDDQLDIQRGRGMVPELFQGGHGADGTQNNVMSSFEYQSQGLKTISIDGDYYISPEFLDKFTVHIVKNFLDLPKIKVPLILGIWGGKGQGKTFQVELAMKSSALPPLSCPLVSSSPVTPVSLPSCSVSVTVRLPTLSRRVRWRRSSSTTWTLAPVAWAAPPSTP